MHPQPPRRTTHTLGNPQNPLVYDRWGTTGRPVVLLHGLLFDRTMWWPVAAELTTDATIIAPDLPGHGDTPPRSDCSSVDLAAELAALVHALDLRRAPIVVAHATSSLLTSVFVESFATHRVITVDEPPARRSPDVDDLITAAGIDDVPPPYRQFATPRRDPALLQPYRAWFGRPVTRFATSLGSLAPAGRQRSTEPATTRFAHLTDPERFAAGLRALL